MEAVEAAAEFNTISEMLFNVITHAPCALETLIVHFSFSCFPEKSLWDRICCRTLDIMLSDRTDLVQVKFVFQAQHGTPAHTESSVLEDELRLLKARFPRIASRKSLTVAHRYVHVVYSYRHRRTF